jgi:hypothetical protein
VKDMHRILMLTAAYQRESNPQEIHLQKDPENRLLARFSRRRLAVEELRDSLLLAAGKLELTMGEGHPFPPEEQWKYTQHGPFNAVYDHNKRSAFLMTQRQRRHPLLALFDGADPSASTPQRQTTTVPPQALFFLNNPFFHEQAAALAAHLAPLPEDALRLSRVYRALFQRKPSSAEIQHATGFLTSYGAESAQAWKAYCRILLAGNEFLHID